MSGASAHLSVREDRIAAPADLAVRAADALRQDGVAVLDGVIDPVLLARCAHQIARTWPDLEAEDDGGTYGLAARRFSLPLPIAAALADPAVFASPPVLDLVERALGPRFELDSYGLLVSLPGAPEQVRHYDALLYPELALDRVLPATALAVAVPLVPMDALSGTTAFWRGSHRDPSRDGAADFAPTVPVGSALVWDYRIHHHGLANRSEQPRPVLFAVFCRPWWREEIPRGAKAYERLAVSRAGYDALGPSARRLLARARILDDVAEPQDPQRVKKTHA